MDHILHRCVEERSRGADFPTVWSTILSGHPLVAEPPVQALRNGHPVLKVRLVTGHDLVHGPDGYWLE